MLSVAHIMNNVSSLSCLCPIKANKQNYTKHTVLLNSDVALD